MDNIEIQPIEPEPNDWGILEEPLLPMGDNFDSAIIHRKPVNPDKEYEDSGSETMGSRGTWANPAYTPKPIAPRSDMQSDNQNAHRGSEKFELTPIAIVTEPDPKPDLSNQKPEIADEAEIAEENRDPEPFSESPATGEKSEKEDRETTAGASTLTPQEEKMEPVAVQAIESPNVREPEPEPEPEPVMASSKSPAQIAEREHEYHDSTLETSGNDSKGGLIGFMSRIFKS